MTSPLDHLKELTREPADTKEFEGLKRAGLARLKDAANAQLSKDSRFDLAYNASHSLCLAALRYRGYRSAKRYLVFQTLPHTLGLGPEVWRVLAKAHDVRNKREYEGETEVDERLLTDVIAACGAVSKAIGALKPL